MGIKLGINGQQAAHRSIPVVPNHIRVLAVVTQCHKYSSNIWKLTLAPFNLLFSQSSEVSEHLGGISLQTASHSHYTMRQKSRNPNDLFCLCLLCPMFFLHRMLMMMLIIIRYMILSEDLVNPPPWWQSVCCKR